MKPPCHDCTRWEGKCAASQRVWSKCDKSGTYSEFKPKGDRFTRGPRDTWNGIVDGFGQSNFSVIGTYGDKFAPRIVINRSEEPTNCHSLAIDWNTGKVLKSWGNGNSPVDHIE
jgi:hypothetical protein